MIPQPPRHEQQIGNAELYHILKTYDPLQAPAASSLAGLEAAILAQIGQTPQRAAPAMRRTFAWISAFDVSLWAAVAAVLVIVVTCFAMDRMTYTDGDEISLSTAQVPMLFALADEETSSPLSATSWGYDDDNDQ